MNYVTLGAPNPMNSQGMSWCRICKIIGHRSEECLYLQKIISALANLYYKLCRLVGDHEKHCRAYQSL